MKKDKINKESDNSEVARDKGVNSTDLLGKNEHIKNEPENIGDDLIIGSFVKHKGKFLSFYVRLKKEDQNWNKVFEVTGKRGFLPAITRGTIKDNKFILGDPFDYI